MNYILVLGGCSWDFVFKQNIDKSYSNTATGDNPGGKGANQAVACVRAGYPTKIISAIGNDCIGKRIVENLSDNRVNIDAVKTFDCESDNTSAYISLEGENELVRKVNAITKLDEECINENMDLFLKADCVVLNTKLPKKIYEMVINLCYKNKIPTVLTPCPSNVIKCNDAHNMEVLKKVTYITANKKETLEITQSNNINEAINKFHNIITTAGEEGVYYYDNNKVQKISSIKPKEIIDTTGAGDTFCAYFIVSLMQGCELKKAIKRGICASTLKIQNEGAQNGMPYYYDVDNFYNHVFIDKNIQNYYIDLHFHSTNSDGEFSVQELLKMCEKLNLDIISITDHDSVQAYYDIQNEKLQFKGRVLVGTELTYLYDGRAYDCLAYGFNVNVLNKWLDKHYSYKLNIAKQNEILQKIISLYKKLEIKFDENIIIETGFRAEAYNKIKKSVKKYQENKELFPEFWQDAFYKRCHTNPNSKYYIDETKNIPTLEEVVDVVHKAGGLCSLAHPGAYYRTDMKQLEDYIIHAVCCGVDAIEYKYTTHNTEIERKILEIAQKYNVMLTGGSDFHGAKRPTYYLGYCNRHNRIHQFEVYDFLNKIEDKLKKY